MLVNAQPESVASSITSLGGIGIVGTGQALGSEVISNEDLAISHAIDPDWIVARTGIRQRQHAAKDVTTADLACQASQRCLHAAGVDPGEVDLLLVATLSPDHLVPSVASFVVEHLKLNAGAMDIHASCAGFIYALVTAAQFVSTGSCRKVLVIGADTSSRFADPSDRKLYPLFGDGAGAVLLGQGKADQGIVAFDLGSDGSGLDLLHVSRDAQPRLSMNGPRVFKWAVNKLCQSIDDVLTQSRKRVDEIDKFVFHQANLRILTSVANAMNIDRSQLVTGVECFGNTATASIPLALDQANRSEPFDDGDHVMLAGFGGGMSWGTCLLRW